MKEERKLMLMDLCARLPYRVKARLCDGVKEEIDDIWDIDMFSGAINADYIIDDIQPYLRPMSSMTEEEKKELKEIGDEYLDQWMSVNDPSVRWKLDANNSSKRAEFYNSHYLDWNGLIERGMALEALEGMYKTE